MDAVCRLGASVLEREGVLVYPAEGFLQPGNCTAKPWTVPLKSNLTRSLCFSPDGKRLAVVQFSNVSLLDSTTGKEQRVLKAAYSPLVTVAGLLAVALVLIAAYRTASRALVPLIPIVLATGWSSLVLWVARVSVLLMRLLLAWRAAP